MQTLARVSDVHHRYIPIAAILAVALLFAGCGSQKSETMQTTEVMSPSGGETPIEAQQLWPEIYEPALDDFADVAFEAHPHIVSIRFFMDAMDMQYAETLEETLRQEPGIRDTEVDPDSPVVGVIPTDDTSQMELYSLVNAVNAIRVGGATAAQQYTVIRTDVLAVGTLEEYTIEMDRDTTDLLTHKRYKLVAGPEPDDVFILVENNKLEDMLRVGADRIGEEYVIVVGKVTAFNGRVPVLEITDYLPVKG